MFQEARLFPSLAVAETLAVALERHVDVREPLACALAHEPAVLLLDEPSAGIEQRETEVLGDLLLGVREQTGARLSSSSTMFLWCRQSPIALCACTSEGSPPRETRRRC